MARFILLLSFFLVALAVGVSNADSSAEDYWRSVLPNSPMPSAIRDLIYPSKAAVPSGHEDGESYATAYGFFLEESLQPGTTMTLHFKRTISGASFLPRQVADSIPFSSSMLPDILSRLSVSPSSEMASSIKKTIAECEAKPLADELKLCATSLESMVDFAKYGLKSSNLRAMSTSIAKAATPKQKYTITGLNKVKASELVACHAQRYVYPVFHCHTTTASAYTVSLSGADGTKIQALAACHKDLAAGVEEAYKKLGLKPGSVPVCHFLPQDDLLWARV
ncbi:BURP domain-containing protein [Rhynchospora pubera]|uniref:BURP domain-containing protein n=1 Tax=Rhynchospora pubera TaxID=906938 RepID=A0AAV8CAT5_9POAL|nr:BURP domain-containing protein [Rhynchospora pubera]KAJ4794549.1 BURP domain-containing protein [Rhynchospora pubera]